MEHKRVNQVSLPRSGAPRKITEDERDRMVEIVLFNDPFIKWRDLAHECETARQETVRKFMSEIRYRKWRNLKRPHIKPEHAAKRLQWALDYQHFTPYDWRQVVWSDECTIERGKGVRQRWVFRRPSEQLREPDLLHDNTRHNYAIKKMF